MKKVTEEIFFQLFLPLSLLVQTLLLDFSYFICRCSSCISSFTISSSRRSSLLFLSLSVFHFSLQYQLETIFKQHNTMICFCSYAFDSQKKLCYAIVLIVVVSCRLFVHIFFAIVGKIFQEKVTRKLYSGAIFNMEQIFFLIFLIFILNCWRISKETLSRRLQFHISMTIRIFLRVYSDGKNST